MSGASIERTLELWASSLRDVKRRMRPLFTQERVARSAEKFLDGLLGEDILREFHSVRIDYRAHVIELED